MAILKQTDIRPLSGIPRTRSISHVIDHVSIGIRHYRNGQSVPRHNTVNTELSGMLRLMFAIGMVVSRTSTFSRHARVSNAHAELRGDCNHILRCLPITVNKSVQLCSKHDNMINNKKDARS